MARKPLRLTCLLPLFFSAILASGANGPVAGTRHIEPANAQLPKPVIGLDLMSLLHGQTNDSLAAAAMRASSNSPQPNAILDVIKALLAQHDTAVASSELEDLKPQIRVPPKESSTHPGLLDIPCYGDGFCCCEGCPPGTCPSIHISNDTGAIQTQVGPDTIAAPCKGDTYCCCSTGCPPGTCTTLPAFAAMGEGYSVPDNAGLTSSIPFPASTSIPASPEPTSLLACCSSGMCPAGLCDNLVKDPARQLNELLFCCTLESCPYTCTSNPPRLKFVDLDFSTEAPVQDILVPSPNPDVELIKAAGCNCRTGANCPPGVCFSNPAMVAPTDFSLKQDDPLASPQLNAESNDFIKYSCCLTNTCAANICYSQPALDVIRRFAQQILAATSAQIPAGAKSEL